MHVVDLMVMVIENGHYYTIEALLDVIDVMAMVMEIVIGLKLLCM